MGNVAFSQLNDQPWASAYRRVGAFGVDYLVFAGYIAIISAVFAVLPRSLVDRLFATPTSGQITVIFILTAPVLLYFSLLERSPFQATVGKRALRLRVTDLHGRRISFGRSVARSALKLVPWELAHTCLWRIEGWPAPTAAPHGLPLIGLILVWLIVGAYLVAIVASPRRQSLYDMVARTLVVRRPEPVSQPGA